MTVADDRHVFDNYRGERLVARVSFDVGNGGCEENGVGVALAEDGVLAVEFGYGVFALDLSVGHIGTAVPIEVVSLDTVRAAFEVNVFGQLAMIQAFLPLLPCEASITTDSCRPFFCRIALVLATNSAE